VTGIKQEEGESKKRIKKTEDPARRNSARIEDALDSPVLTKKVWDEVYEIFKLHFSTEMPFLHPPTFRNRMRQASYPRDPSTPAADLHDGKILLLGVLTLTARFHPDLIDHHSQSGNPLDASEYYAAALKTAFGPTGGTLTSPSIDGVQALLMLGLYEWGQTRGLSAWVYVGIAMRLAQSMGLAYEDDPESRSFKRPSSRRERAKPPSTSKEEITEREVRRRTLWSCFIMDRMLSAGKYRPNMISVEKLQVQLPCSDDQFLFAHIGQTGFLDSELLERTTPIPSSGKDDAPLSRYIRLVEIFGRFSEWSYAGGRRTEKSPPWDPTARFFKLRQELEAFHATLPDSLIFNNENLSAHIEKRNATTYASMHTLYSLCLIMLHREYIPFVALRCKGGPVGPLDEPTFPPNTEPKDFWVNSAENIFEAGKNILDIVRMLQDDNALPESPLMGFAVWQAAFVCVYAAHFPHMDTGRYLTREGGTENRGILIESYDTMYKQILNGMASRLRTINGYGKSLKRMNAIYFDIKHKYLNNQPDKIVGGGLETYKLLEKELKEFGALEDQDKAHSDGSDPVDQARSRASTNDIGQGSVNGESMQGVEAAPTPRAAAWAPINATSPTADAEDRVKYPGFPSNNIYHQSPNQNSNPPSLISPSNGESTPSINSPYTQGQTYQPQHAASYHPPIAQHTPAAMAPPLQGWSNQFDIGQYEQRISMSGGLDNLSQIYPDDTNCYAEYDNLPQQQVNFYEFVSQYPQVGYSNVVVEQR